MYFLYFSEQKCYVQNINKISGRGFSGYFAKSFEDVVEIFKRHFSKSADEKCKSVVSLSSLNVDYSRFILIKDDKGYRLEFTPLKVSSEMLVRYFGKSRSWDFVIEILGFRPELVFVYD